MAEIRELHFGALGELFDGPHATPTRIDEGPWFLNIASLKSGRLDLAEADHVSAEDFEKWTKRVVPREGDLLFSYETRLGEAALMPAGISGCLGRRMALLRPDQTLVHPRYLLYYYLSPAFQRLIAAHTIHGATVPRIGLATMPDWKVSIHEMAEQVAIAEVLGALDDKITANAGVSGTLSRLQAVEARAMLSSARRRAPLLDHVVPVKGVSYRSADLGGADTALVTLKCVGRDGGFNIAGYKAYAGVYKDSQVVQSGEIVVAQTDITQSGDVIGRAVRVPRGEVKTLVASLDLIILRSRGELTTEYILAALQQQEFRTHASSFASGTTVLHLGRGALESYELPIADSLAVERYTGIARNHDELVDGLAEENRTLARTRDELLPLLMSGKVTVKQAERRAEEVL